MEINKINCLLNTKDIDRLKEFKNYNISVFSEVLNGKTVVVKLKHDDIVYFVTNEPTEQIDLDEYPVLRINPSLAFSFTENFELKNAKLLSMYLIRDKICWIRDGIKW